VIRLALAASITIASLGASAAHGSAKRGPSTAALTFAGDSGLAGLATNPKVSCNEPSADGSTFIFLLDQPPDPSVTFNMRFMAGKVMIGVYSGSGTSFRGRTFEGTGVTGFNPAKGAHVDSTLTETTADDPTLDPGTLGAITSITGSIDCGNQKKGKSSVKFHGATAEGSVKGRLHPFRVECDTSASFGNSVHLVGVLSVGSTKALVNATFQADSITLFETINGPPAATRRYLVKSPGVATLTAHGAHVNGTVVEQNPQNGAAAQMLVLKGKVTCGTTVNE
jgi:hypothetical protein